MPIRPFLVAGASAAALLCFAFIGAPAQDRPEPPTSRPLAPGSSTKERLLRGTVQGAIAPRYADLARAFRSLCSACDQAADAPSQGSLSAAQEAWRGAMIAWKRAKTMPAGPLTDHDYLNNIHFWPVRPPSIEKVLHEAQPLDAASFENLGAAVTGLGTLEYLLFDVREGDRAVLDRIKDPKETRRRTYLTLLAHELQDKAALVEREWTAGDGYGKRFAAGGQDSVNLLVNHLVVAIEGPTDGRLRSTIALHSSNMLQPELIESAPSQVSQTTFLAAVAACRELYRGGTEPGLDDFLQAHNRPLHERIEAQFAKTLAAIDAIGEPLESAVRTKKPVVMKAYEECKALELLLKVDLVSALGVTLTFGANDGD